MASKQNRNPINGWLNIHKPKGMTSTRVVSIIKRYYHAQKVGHAGTLDPLASGVLPIALGEATKTIQFSMDAEKEYLFTVQWGAATSTCDTEGDIVSTSDKMPTPAEIQAALPYFTGIIDQTPPAYSAIKIDGKRACDRMREGEDVVMKSRQVTIHSIECITHTPETAQFRVACSKGTYVRSLARDIAEKLGTKGHVIELIRTKVGKFCLDNAILLEVFENNVYKTESSGLLLPVDEVLDDIPVLSFYPEQTRAFRQGQTVEIAQNAGFDDGQLVVVKDGDVLVALGTTDGKSVKPTRVFNI